VVVAVTPRDGDQTAAFAAAAGIPVLLQVQSSAQRGGSRLPCPSALVCHCQEHVPEQVYLEAQRLMPVAHQLDKLNSCRCGCPPHSLKATPKGPHRPVELTERLQTWFLRCSCQATPKGLTDLWNQVLSRCLAGGYDHCFLANNDVLVGSGTVGAMVSALRTGSHGVFPMSHVPCSAGVVLSMVLVSTGPACRVCVSALDAPFSRARVCPGIVLCDVAWDAV
jgi:hypothetical protein